jgi:Barnase-EndoU-ColicinE5/D-RelE like nuclease
MRKETTIKSFIRECLRNKSNKKMDIVINKISDAQAEKVKTLIGVDITGYTRVLDNYSVLHTFKKHGNMAAENLRGQVQVTADDFEFITDITVPENIIMTSKNKLGKDTILYQATISNIYFYVEEIREKRKQLVLNTMYKRKPPGRPGGK